MGRTALLTNGTKHNTCPSLSIRCQSLDGLENYSKQANHVILREQEVSLFLILQNLTLTPLTDPSVPKCSPHAAPVVCGVLLPWGVSTVSNWFHLFIVGCHSLSLEEESFPYQPDKEEVIKTAASFKFLKVRTFKISFPRIYPMKYSQTHIQKCMQKKEYSPQRCIF